MEDYMVELNELRLLLKDLLKKEYLEELLDLYSQLEHAYIEKWTEVVEASKHGRKCNYAIQAKVLFEKLKEKDVSARIREIYEKYLKDKEGAKEECGKT